MYVHTSRDIIRYFSAVTSEDPVYIYIYIVYGRLRIAHQIVHFNRKIGKYRCV